MSLLKDRLKIAMQGPPEVKPSELARACGIKQPSVNDWLTGRTKNIVGKNLLNAARALNVNPDWLASGKGPMKNQGPYTITNADHASSNVSKVPCIKCEDFVLWLYNSGDISVEYIYTELKLPQSAFGLKIKGNAMLPRFKDGDTVIINPDIKPKPSNFVAAVVNDNDTVFLKYRAKGIDSTGNEIFELVPLNDDYPSLRSDDINIKIIGTMVEHRTYDMT